MSIGFKLRRDFIRCDDLAFHRDTICHLFITHFTTKFLVLLKIIVRISRKTEQTFLSDSGL